MKRTWMAVLLFATIAAAQSSEYPPRPDGTTNWVTDLAGVIEPGERTRINEIARDLLREKQIPIIVVTVPGLQGQSVERFATTLFDTWEIGSAKRNYGMLLLVATGARRARIELGAAWGRSGDSDARRIMDTLIIPRFKAGDYSVGVLEGVRGLDAMARGDALPTPARPGWWWPLWIGGGLLAVGTIASVMRSGNDGWGAFLLGILGSILVALFFRGDSSGGSGGGGSFGGGFSGGGGASGSW